MADHDARAIQVHRRKGISLRTGVLSALLVSAWLQAWPTWAQQAQSPASDRRRYDIASQPLDRALMELGTVSRIDILYENGVVDKKRSHAVAGNLTEREAIAVMLQGTGLSFRFTSLNAVLVFPPERPPEPGVDAWVKAEGPPRLVLDTLRVTAPPMIGTPSRARFEPFGRTVQAAINQRLQNDPRTSARPFRVRLTVEIDAAGLVRRPTIIHSSGDEKLDRDIRQVLDGARMPAPPPADLPQPVWFEVAAR